MAGDTNPMNWMTQFMENNLISTGLGGRTEEFIKAQDDVVADIHEYVDHWCKRRHEGTKAALKCARHISDEDPVDRAKALSDWFTGMAQRLSEDTREQMEWSQKVLSHFSFASSLTPFSFGMFLTPQEQEEEKSVSRRSGASKAEKAEKVQ